jgi:hypothetical protein
MPFILNSLTFSRVGTGLFYQVRPLVVVAGSGDDRIRQATGSSGEATRVSTRLEREFKMEISEEVVDTL